MEFHFFFLGGGSSLNDAGILFQILTATREKALSWISRLDFLI